MVVPVAGCVPRHALAASQRVRMASRFERSVVDIVEVLHAAEALDAHRMAGAVMVLGREAKPIPPLRRREVTAVALDSIAHPAPGVPHSEPTSIRRRRVSSACTRSPFF